MTWSCRIRGYLIVGAQKVWLLQWVEDNSSWFVEQNRYPANSERPTGLKTGIQGQDQNNSLSAASWVTVTLSITIRFWTRAVRIVTTVGLPQSLSPRRHRHIYTPMPSVAHLSSISISNLQWHLISYPFHLRSFLSVCYNAIISSLSYRSS